MLRFFSFFFVHSYTCGYYFTFPPHISLIVVTLFILCLFIIPSMLFFFSFYVLYLTYYFFLRISLTIFYTRHGFSFSLSHESIIITLLLYPLISVMSFLHFVLFYHWNFHSRHCHYTIHITCYFHLESLLSCDSPFSLS